MATRERSQSIRRVLFRVNVGDRIPLRKLDLNRLPALGELLAVVEVVAVTKKVIRVDWSWRGGEDKAEFSRETGRPTGNTMWTGYPVIDVDSL